MDIKITSQMIKTFPKSKLCNINLEEVHNFYKKFRKYSRGSNTLISVILSKNKEFKDQRKSSFTFNHVSLYEDKRLINILYDLNDLDVIYRLLIFHFNVLELKNLR